MPSDPPCPLCSQAVLDFSLILLWCNTHPLTLHFPHFLFLPDPLLLIFFFFLFLVNANSSSSSGCTVCVGLMYLLICSHSSPLLSLFSNCKEQDNSVMYLNWMLTAAAENVSSLFINQEKKNYYFITPS